MISQREAKKTVFLVQGLMKFTGPNKIATVELTKAHDVEGKFEIGFTRERKVESTKMIGSKKLELKSIEKTGWLTIFNHRNEEIDCKVDYLLYGHLDESKPICAEVTEQQAGYHIPHLPYSTPYNRHLNPIAKYVWQLKAPAKGKAELSFTYFIKE